MSINKIYYKEIYNLIIKTSILPNNIKYDDIISNIDIPPSDKPGEFALPCFSFAKTLKCSPINISKDIYSSIEQILSKNPSEIFDSINLSGPYINFSIKKLHYTNNCFNKVSEIFNKGQYTDEETIKEKIVIDFSSPNIAKPFSISHLRSTTIGNSIAEINKFLGNTVIKINHLGDWGSSFAKLIVASEIWGSGNSVKSVDDMLSLYIKYHQEIDSHSEHKSKYKEITKGLENNDKILLKKWEYFKNISLNDLHKTYNLLNINFDYFTGESFYIDKTQEVINELIEKKIATNSNSALIVDLATKLNNNLLNVLVIQTSENTSLYSTRDLAALLYRKKKFNFDRAIYVVGSDQNLYFKQIFSTIKLLGYDWHKNCCHKNFGLVKLKNLKMSTRKGSIIKLNDIINKLKERLKENNPKQQSDKNITDLCISSIIFYDLKTNTNTDVVFEWDEMLNPKGDTGIYVQYTHARTESILNKYYSDSKNDKVKHEIIQNTSLICDDSFKIIKLIANFYDNVKDAQLKSEPYLIARSILNICKNFNSFYSSNIILDKNKVTIPTTIFRVTLTKIVNQTLKTGLKLLGIKHINSM